MFRQRPKFDGATFDAAKDEQRLTGQLQRVMQAMRDGNWWTLRLLADRVGGSEAGVSARLRDLRKPQFGGTPDDVERRRVMAGGLYEYRWVPRNGYPKDMDT